MKEQEFKQALQRMTAAASFSAESRHEVMEHIQNKRSTQSIRLPAPRKRSMVLVMLLVLLVITVGAMAAEGWGILSFLQSRGKTATEEQLLSLYEPVYYYPDGTVAEPWYPEDPLVQAEMTEALYDDGKLYMAITLKPAREKTLVVPVDDPQMGKRYKYRNYIGMNDQNLAGISMQAALNDPAYGDVSVLDYAKANGFDQVVLLHNFAISVDSSQSTWSHDAFGGLQHTEYDLLADGTLQFILDTDYRPNLAYADADRWDWAGVSMEFWAFDITGEVKLLEGSGESVSGHFALSDGQQRWRSIEADAHDIVGYIGAVEYILIAPYNEEHMAITVTLNEREYFTKEEDTWMTGPKWVIMDEAGNRLCEVDYGPTYDLRTYQDEDGNRYYYHHGIFPAEFMPEGGQIILRAENRNNKYIVYDEYVYTLITNQEAEEEEHK